MPNTPLQVFRTVEPANYAFGATATLASSPFVLYHVRSSTAHTNSDQLAATFPAPTISPTRFLPWVNRLDDSVYPVKIPAAYDRIYVFPMLVLDTVPNTAGTPVIPVAFINDLAGWIPPQIIPFGLLPETKNTSLGGKMQQALIPDDVIRTKQPLATPQFSVREHGMWMPLPTYASNFTTSNVSTALHSATAFSSVPRNLVTGAGVGGAYALPRDVSISNSTAASTTLADPKIAAYTSSVKGPMIGQGLEFATTGCQEIVLSLASAPVYPTYTINAGTAGVNGAVGANFFMMGVFLG